MFTTNPVLSSFHGAVFGVSVIFSMNDYVLISLSCNVKRQESVEGHTESVVFLDLHSIVIYECGK
jgi:hypothetical protein